MPATREDLVRIAREAAGGINRPAAHCEGTYVAPWGATETVTVECEHTIRNPASYDPPEWVIDALRAAYERGDRDGYQRCANVPSVGGPSYASTSRPRHDDIDDIREHG
jgi:hypothetical protein